MLTTVIHKIPNNLRKFLPWFVLGIILFVFILGALHYARITLPVMDEGTYLIKGRMYLDGTYVPFQDYGPITNKPPLAFQILGLSQLLFEPGLASGRYFAIFLACLLIIGQWLTVRRLSGDIWAFFIGVLFCISPAWMIYFMRPMTQGITALFVVWSLFFTLGKGRSGIQLSLGLICANLTVLTRSNMIPFLGFIYVYVFIENGWKKSALPLFTGILSFLAYNAFYWPRIYTLIWQYVLPGPFNSLITKMTGIDKTIGDLGIDFLDKQFRLIDKIQVFFDTFRFFFLPFLATLLGSLLAFTRQTWRNPLNREMLFLVISYLVPAILQFYYIVGEDFTLYSFPSYFAFYLPVGLTLLPLVWQEIKSRNYTRLFPISLSILLPLITAGIGLSLYRDVSGYLMKLKLPSFDPPFQISFKYEIWDVLLTRFGMDPLVQEFVVPSAAGFLIGFLLVILLGIIWKISLKTRLGFGTFLAGVILLFGFILSPTYLLAGKDAIRTCPGVDIPAAYAQTSRELENLLPDGASVYFEGYTPNVLIPLTDLRLYPAQLNMLFYYQIGGDVETLEKYGYWNAELADRWQKEADFILVSPLVAELRGLSGNPQFRLIATTNSADLCMENTPILIFSRVD